jgi:acyl-CoA synthetase (AMP-forming)/AMP-acid ligase II/thioesterase domain-containing protein/acyl carrier protein
LTIESEPRVSLHADWQPASPVELPSFTAVLEAACRQWPDSPAAWDGRTRLSYGELDSASAAVAAGLQHQPGTGPVAVLTETTVDALIALAGVLRSGRPMVMLDRALPVPRLKAIAQLARPDLVLADDASLDVARQVAGDSVPLRTVADLRSDGLPLAAVRTTPDSLAAILFTSGSSGQPKGVLWPQRLLAAEALTTGQRMGYREHERVAMALPLGFAAGLAVAAVAIRWGCTLLMRDPREVGAGAYLDWVRQERATVIHTTPSMLRSFLGTVDDAARLPDLRVWTACGEALYDSDIARARRHLSPDARFVQWLGSSEGCSLAFVAYSATDPLPRGAIPCGTASSWRRFRIVGDDGREVAPTEAGNVVVTTPVLSDGYLDDPERSAQKFVRRDDGLWDLHTGDVGALDADGVLRLLGRSEAAVKIRGYLVDPSEIEASLLASGRVAEAVVVARTDDGPTSLVAYFVPRRGSSAASVAALRAWLSSQLPLWMVPAHFVALRELPRNERGKIDRQALPAVPHREVEPPQGPLESQVAEIWADLLHVDQVGRNDDFMELGGDSLDVEEMLVRVEDQTGIKLLTSDFTQATRLSDFVDRLVANVSGVKSAPWPETVVRMRDGDSDRTVFCIAGGGATAWTFAPLTPLLDPLDSVVTLQARGVGRRAPMEWTFNGMVRRRIARIRRLQPQGPYLIVGHSLGAVLAQELARRMAARGDAVTTFLIDPYFLPHGDSGRWRAFGTLLLGDRPARGWLSKTTLRRLAEIPLVLAAGLLPASLDRRFALTFRHSALVSNWHRPRSSTVPGFAYRTEENADPIEVWTRLLPAATIRELPCSHMSILQRPFIEEIAADIGRAQFRWRG